MFYACMFYLMKLSMSLNELLFFLMYETATYGL
jgi:hypothetical protein